MKFCLSVLYREAKAAQKQAVHISKSAQTGLQEQARVILNLLWHLLKNRLIRTLLKTAAEENSHNDYKRRKTEFRTPASPTFLQPGEAEAFVSALPL